MEFVSIRKISWPRLIVGAVCLIALGVVVGAADEPPIEPVPQAEPPQLPVPAEPVPRPVDVDLEPFAPQAAGPSHEFITDRTAVRQVELAARKLGEEEYDDAVRLLQMILDREQDGVIPNEDSEGFESLKSRADRLLADLPPEAQETYELHFGVAAREQLEEAWKKGDWQTVEEISRRFFRTEAGAEATYRLAIRAIDRGRAMRGALLLDRLRQTGSERFEPGLTMRLVLAAERAGLTDLAEEARARWEALSEQQAGGAVAAAGRERFTRWLERPGADVNKESNLHWTGLAGGQDGAVASERVTVAGGAEWSYAFTDSDADAAASDPLEKELRRGIEQATKNARAEGEITLPAFFPVVVGETAVFRTFRDIRAIDTSTGRLLWRTAGGRDPLFDTAMKEVYMLLDEGLRDLHSMSLVAQVYLSQNAWRNMTSGMLSTDGQRVYAIEHVGMASSGTMITGTGHTGLPIALGRDPYNRLLAYDLEAEGRIAWMLGGPPSSPRTTGLFFLGPPISVGRWLFALAEQDGEIQLVAIDPDADEGERIAWRQPLVAADRSILDDPVRRISGLSPAFANGLLICPTGTGAVVAVDLRDRTLRWGYRYDANTETQQEIQQFGGGRMIMGFTRPDQADRGNRWIDAVPRIDDRYVLMTPRDSDELHCLDLETGELRWSRDRENFLYVGAIVDGQAVLVGSDRLAAIDLATNELRWQTPLEMDQRPSGRGIVSGEVYYLPTVAGGVASIDLASGSLLGTVDVGAEFGVGNLAAAGGRLVGVSTRAIVGFRDGRAVDAGGEGSSDNEAIALRGEHRLMHGELAAGIADLRAASGRDESGRARDLLVETLLGGLRRDFARYREHVPDLQALVETPKERVELARIQAEGLARAGEAVQAAGVLLTTCEESEYLKTFEQRSDDWRVRRDRVIRTELGEIYADAPPEDQARIDRLIEERLARAAGMENENGLSVLATVAYETGARQTVFDALMARYRFEGDVLRQALLRLEFSPDESDAPNMAPTSGNDVSTSVRMATSFPTDLKARYQPDELGSPRAETRIPVTHAIRVFGSVPEQFSGWQFQMDAGRRDLIARDRFGRERWRMTIREADSTRSLPANLERFQARFQGPLLVVCADTQLAAIDTSSGIESPRLLWSKTLAVSDGISFQIRNPDPRAGSEGPASRFGFAGPRVILHADDDSITAVDAVSGGDLWSIAAGNIDRDLLGDSEYVALADSPGQAFVRRTSDGAPVVRYDDGDLNASRLATLGTNMVRWEWSDRGCAVACHDIARDEPLWRFEFPSSAMHRMLGADSVAVLDPETGQLRVIRWTDGQVVLTGAIKPNPRINGFSIEEFGDGLVLYAMAMNRNHLGSPSRLGGSWEPFRGVAHGLDSSGRVRWSAALEDCMLHRGIAAGVPLVITSQGREGAIPQQPRWTLTVRDARTGEVLIEQSREKQFAAIEAEGLPAQRRIEVRMPNALIVVEQAGTPDERSW